MTGRNFSEFILLDFNSNQETSVLKERLTNQENKESLEINPHFDLTVDKEKKVIHRDYSIFFFSRNGFATTINY